MESIHDYIEFRIDADKKLLYGKWLRNVNSEEYIAAMKYIIELIEAQGIRLWLQNSFNLDPRSLEEQRWIAEEFALLLSQSSLKYMAFVVSKDSPHHTILIALREKGYRIFGKSINMELFESEEEALGWLIPNMQYYRLPSQKLIVKPNSYL